MLRCLIKMHQNQRLEWVCKIWGDESRFAVSFGDTSKLVIREAASIMVWGRILAQGVDSLYIIDGNMNSDKYQNVLGHSDILRLP